MPHWPPPQPRTRTWICSSARACARRVAALALIGFAVGCSSGAHDGRGTAGKGLERQPRVAVGPRAPDTARDPAPAATSEPAPGLAAPPAQAPDEPPRPVIARPAPGSSPRVCKRSPFAVSLPLAEASGATYVPHARAPYLVVAGDSGTRGQVLELDPDTGAVLHAGHLPLDRQASDDLEGLSLVGDTLYGITSAGWMRHWRRLPPGDAGEARYELVRPAYPVAPGNGDPALVCDSPRATNCARNYEGLCLRNTPGAGPGPGCAGFAASKTDGVLYCLVFAADGTLAVDPRRAIAVARGETLTGCHFAPDEDLLWVGSNLFGGNRVSTVTGWGEPARARVEVVGMLGSGFGEAIAVGPGRLVYRFSDTASSRSLADKYICE